MLPKFNHKPSVEFDEKYGTSISKTDWKFPNGYTADEVYDEIIYPIVNNSNSIKNWERWGDYVAKLNRSHFNYEHLKNLTDDSMWGVLYGMVSAYNYDDIIYFIEDWDYTNPVRKNENQQIKQELIELGVNKDDIRWVISPKTFAKIKKQLTKSNTRFDDGGLIAPNGKPSNLNPEQWKLVRTPAFKEWFGDWENDPANSSKVIDSNGEPLVVWRGVKTKKYTTKNNQIFSLYDYQKKGYIYFAKNKSYAQIFGDTLYPFFLKITNPLDLEFFNKISAENGLKSFNNEGLFQIGDTQLKNEFENEIDLLYLENLTDVVDKFYYLLKNGDGIIGYDIGSYGEELVFVTKQHNQIKLADGSNITFDSENPDIRYAGGGDVNNKIVIRKIREEDIPEITENLAQVFDKTGWTSSELWGVIGGVDMNISVVAEYDNQLAGFYFLNENNIPRIDGNYSRFYGKKGVEGVALGVFKKFKDKGVGKKLIEYSQNNLDYDYIWGYQMKVLDNINDWLKRREMYQEYSNMYITYRMLKYDDGGQITNYTEFYDNLQIEDGTKYIGQKFGNVFPYLNKKRTPNDFRIDVKQHYGIVKRLQENRYSTQAMKQRDLNKLKRMTNEQLEKKKYLSGFYLDSAGVIISFKPFDVD